MIIIISPAKTLDLDSPKVTVKASKPKFLKEANQLNKCLATFSQAKLKKLMNISDKLASNVESFVKSFAEQAVRKPAIMMYQGDVYQAFDFTLYSAKQLDSLNSRVRIISGMYGLLRPFDKIEPYRLEMKTKLGNAAGKDLYSFWGDKLAIELDRSAKAAKTSVIVNLASNEYAKAISKKLKAAVVKVDFKDFKNGQYKTIGIFAKKARGEMTDYLIRENIRSIDKLKQFKRNGYKFSVKLSTENEIVFIRNKNK